MINPVDHAQCHAHGGGCQVVGRALENEHLHQAAALGANCARHAHLRLALGSQHHEDQEDQNQPSGDAETGRTR